MTSRTVRTSSAALLPTGVAVAGLAASAMVMLVEPGSGAPYPACPSWSLAGVLCPFCGSLRGVHALLSGDLASMLSFNIMLPFVIVLAGWGWVRWATISVGAAWTPPPLPRSRAFWWGTAAVALVYALLRNLPGGPFTVLAP